MKATEIVDNFKTKHKEGFTHYELVDLCEQEGIELELFLDKLGVNTCMMKDGDILTYHCDVELALTLIDEDRDMYSYEWD